MAALAQRRRTLRRVPGSWLAGLLSALVAGAGAAEMAMPEAGTAAAGSRAEPASAAARAPNRAVERGRYLFHAALCAGCHTADDGKPLAGGRPIESPFGTFWSSNITPDPEHGIGGWTDEDFVRALSEGVSPAGKHYYPAFPYTSFTRLTREDMLALKAYLDSVEPVAEPNRPHDLVWFAGWRWPLGIWKALFFEPGTMQPDPGRSASWNRGAYLSEAAAHCAECHSPRNLLGAIETDAGYAGAEDGFGGGGTPNITPDKETGIGTWTPDMLAFYLEIGMDPDGDFAGGAMAHVIDVGTGKLTPADRAAIAEYILSLPAVVR
jgi:mono/diheme cytochrome c family protein